MVTPAVRREAVVHMCEAHGVSQRRACDVLQIDRSTVRYLSRRGDDAELRPSRQIALQSPAGQWMQSNAYLVNGVGLVAVASM